MAEKTFEELYSEFMEIAEKGDEQAAKNFLIEHLKEFPANIQDAIITGLVGEALTMQADQATAVAEFQQKGMEAMKALDETQAKIEQKDKLLQIKESI